jgi:hyperosmotically inducible protein
LTVVGDAAEEVQATTAGAEAKADAAAETAADPADRQPSAADTWISAKVQSQFIGVAALAGSDIVVNTADGVVTLTGHAASADAKARAAAIARKIDGVKKVENRLVVDVR